MATSGPDTDSLPYTGSSRPPLRRWHRGKLPCPVEVMTWHRMVPPASMTPSHCPAMFLSSVNPDYPSRHLTSNSLTGSSNPLRSTSPRSLNRNCSPLAKLIRSRQPLSLRLLGSLCVCLPPDGMGIHNPQLCTYSTGVRASVRVQQARAYAGPQRQQTRRPPESAASSCVPPSSCRADRYASHLTSYSRTGARSMYRCIYESISSLSRISS